MKRSIISSLALALIGASAVFTAPVFTATTKPLAAQEVAMKKAAMVCLKPGDVAPKFKGIDDQGKEWNSKDHIGKKIVVFYFYPADMTGGCTKQACAFRDDKTDLDKLGVEVIGVSGDSVKNHKLFKMAHNLNFTLLADSKGAIAKKFGVPTRKGGTIKRIINKKEETLTRNITAARWTFVVDKAGKIAYRNTAVKAAVDSENVKKVIRNLK